MTANELADKLDLIRIELTIQASAMLRQQAEEIEALKLFKEQMKTRKAMVKWLLEESD